MDEGRDAQDITELIEQHYALVYRYAYRLAGAVADAEDLAQETFLTAQAKLYQLREPAHARAWLCAIVRNEYLKNWKRRKVVDLLPLESFCEPAAVLPPETAIDEEQLQDALGQVPEEFRTPIILFYFQDLSYKDIAEHMSLPIGTVMSRLARGKAHLRRRLLKMTHFVSPQSDAATASAEP